MFVMSEDGKLYVFAIEEKAPERSDYFSKKKPEFTGDLQLDKPMHIKELPPIKQMAAGLDHFLAVDKKG
jgi:alpha-tubulin suppressor-like RCC1 family protein